MVKDKSVESMPFSLSATALVNSTVWTIYGIIATDVFVIVSSNPNPNICASLLRLLLKTMPSTQTTIRAP